MQTFIQFAAVSAFQNLIFCVCVLEPSEYHKTDLLCHMFMAVITFSGKIVITVK
jgi:hypothetical protein